MTGLAPCAHRISALIQAQIFNRGRHCALWYDVLISYHTSGVCHQSSRREKEVAHAAVPYPRFRGFNELEATIHAPLVPRASGHWHRPRPSFTCSVMSCVEGAIVPISGSNLRWSGRPAVRIPNMRTQCVRVHLNRVLALRIISPQLPPPYMYCCTHAFTSSRSIQMAPL